MKLVWWMLAGAVVTSWILTILLGSNAGIEIWIAMPGPLAAALVSWFAMERQHRRRPEGLTGLMIKAFAAKMAFFALYVTVLVRIGSIRPVPFAIGFLVSFFYLHIVEAIGLRRLQAVGIGPNRNSS
jgi:hypothetical protein